MQRKALGVLAAIQTSQRGVTCVRGVEMSPTASPTMRRGDTSLVWQILAQEQGESVVCQWCLSGDSLSGLLIFLTRHAAPIGIYS
jgi:hypothetical protein